MDRNGGSHPKFCRQGGAHRDSEELRSNSRDFVIPGAERMGPLANQQLLRIPRWRGHGPPVTHPEQELVPWGTRGLGCCLFPFPCPRVLGSWQASVTWTRVSAEKDRGRASARPSCQSLTCFPEPRESPGGEASKLRPKFLIFFYLSCESGWDKSALRPDHPSLYLIGTGPC